MKFFFECYTVEAVKTLYRDLAKKHHPDLGGDTATMQAVNVEYADAMRRAIPAEENEYRREQAAAGFEPLREAIEFAVTLPENVSVIIRGFWLWLEGETYFCARAALNLLKVPTERAFAGLKIKQLGISPLFLRQTKAENFIHLKKSKQFTGAKLSPKESGKQNLPLKI